MTRQVKISHVLLFLEHVQVLEANFARIYMFDFPSETDSKYYYNIRKYSKYPKIVFQTFSQQTTVSDSKSCSLTSV